MLDSLENSEQESFTPQSHQERMDLLNKFIDSENIADLLDEDAIRDIAMNLIDGIQEDEMSREEWCRDIKRIMKIANMKNEEKNHPWPKASNVKHPLMATASLQYVSQSLTELIVDKKVVKAEILGRDPKGLKQRKGDRLVTYLNYQLLKKQKNWMSEHERLFKQLSIVGTCFTRTYFDSVKKRITTEAIPWDLIVVNDYIKSLDEAPRITEYFYLTKRQVKERIRYGIYSDIDVDKLSHETSITDKTYLEFVRCFTWLDLDSDGFEEPYLVEMHKQSREIFSIIPMFDKEDIEEDGEKILCITPIEMYVDHHMIHSNDCRFHSYGFGLLLLNNNKMINSILNQLIDAGTLSNTQTGFIETGLRMRKGDYRMDPGRLMQVNSQNGKNLADNIYLMQWQQPSNVLFQLLGLLIQSSEKLISVSDISTGMQDATNVSPNTALTLLKQGLKIYTTIQKREARSLGKETEIVMRLNKTHVNIDEYVKVIGIEQQVEVQDPQTGQAQLVPNPEWSEMFQDKQGKFSEFTLTDLEIVPVIDINSSTQAERLIRTQFQINTIQILGPLAPQFINVRAVLYDAYKESGAEKPENYIVPPTPPQQNPQFIQQQADLAKTSATLKLKEREQTVREKAQNIKGMEGLAKMQHLAAETQKTIAQAKAIMPQVQIEAHKAKFDALDKSIGSLATINSMMNQNTEMQTQAKQDFITQNQQQTGNPMDLRYIPPPDKVFQEATRRGWSKK